MKNVWDSSYVVGQNFLFEPHEEVVRFVSKNIRKRLHFDKFFDVAGNAGQSETLDLGCGIGRHIVFFSNMGLSCRGIDLSQEAVSVARDWLLKTGVFDAKERVVQGTVCDLPWRDQFFDYVVSHGVLDSMPFTTACAAITEVARVTRPDGLVYIDLISGDDSEHSADFRSEEIVKTEHERGTVQSYFNREKIDELASKLFQITECKLIKNHDEITGKFASRYHVVLRRR